MAIEEGGCQAVCSSIAEDLLLPALYATGPIGDAQLPPHTTCCSDGDSSEPLSDGVADLALVSPPSTHTDQHCEDQSSPVATTPALSSQEECPAPETCAVSAEETDTELDELKESRSCSSPNTDATVESESTTPSLMCNNSAGPAAAAPSAFTVCVDTFYQNLDPEDDDATIPFPWSPAPVAPAELTMNALKVAVAVASSSAAANQDNTHAEEELHQPDPIDTPAEETTKSTEGSNGVELETAETDMDQSLTESDDMEISFSESFLENADSECGDIEISSEATFEEIARLEKEIAEKDAAMADSSDEACASEASVDVSTAPISDTSDINSCNLDNSDHGSNTLSEEASNITPSKITAAIVVQSNTSYMGNSSSDDDEEDEEMESSDCESLLGRDSPSPPGVDDSSLFPSVEEVETRTGISFESSGPSCSAPSFGNVVGMGNSGAMFSNQADTRRRAITLIDHHFRQIIDVERDLRRYVLHKTNLNRLYQEVREEKLNSHRRQRTSNHHHHHQHHHHSASQSSSHNLPPSPSFLNNPSVSPLAPRSPSPMPFGASSHLNPQSYNRTGAPFPMEAGTGTSSTFCRQAGYGGQTSTTASCVGPHEDCQDTMMEPAPKRARLSSPAEEDKENKYSSVPSASSVFGNAGHPYTPVTSADFYHHQVECTSASGVSASSCNGDAAATTTSPTTSHYNSTGSNNGYYQGQASSAYGPYYNNNGYYANNMAYTQNGPFLGHFTSSSSDSTGTCNHSSSNSSNSSSGNYSMSTGAVEADAYNNVNNNNSNNVTSIDRGLVGFNSNLSSSSSSDSVGFRSNNDIIIEHIDEEIRRQNSITSNNRPASCPPFSSSSSSLFSSSLFSSTSYFSQSLSSSQASSSSSPSLYNTGNNSLQYNNLNHFSSGGGWNTSYSPLYGANSTNAGSCSPPQQQSLQPYPCGRSSLMRGGNDFQSVVYSSLIASLET